MTLFLFAIGLILFAWIADMPGGYAFMFKLVLTMSVICGGLILLNPLFNLLLPIHH